MIVVRNGKFVDGSGLRYIAGEFRSMLHDVFATLSITNSAPVGTVMLSTRMTPRSRSRLYAACRALVDERSAGLLQFEPSTGRKIGSRPSLAANLCWITAADTVHPSSGT